MPKITFLGAGSTVFARNLLGDILTFPELHESTITLFDIDAERHDPALVGVGTQELAVLDHVRARGEDEIHAAEQGLSAVP